MSYNKYMGVGASETGVHPVFCAVDSPDEFPAKAVGWQYMCWGWVSGGEKSWIFSAPYNMGNHHFMSPEWWELYSRTFGRFIFTEAYENFYAPYWKAMNIPHTFVDIGLEYPVLLMQGTNGRKAHYLLRNFCENLWIPPDCTYEDFKKLLVYYLFINNTTSSLGHTYYLYVFEKLEDIHNPAMLNKIFTKEFAAILAKRGGRYDAYSEAVGDWNAVYAKGTRALHRDDIPRNPLQLSKDYPSVVKLSATKSVNYKKS